MIQPQIYINGTPLRLVGFKWIILRSKIKLHLSLGMKQIHIKKQNLSINGLLKISLMDQVFKMH